MLSRMALNMGALRPMLAAQLTSRAVNCVAVRNCSSDHPANWKRAHDIYYGPERDTKNYPAPSQPDTAPPVRMGWIPDSLFQAFYEKTGVTGPYVFGGSVIIYLLSKEIWVAEHGLMDMIAFCGAIYILHRKIGPGLRDYLNKDIDDHKRKRWDEPRQAAITGAEDVIQGCQLAIDNEAGQKYLFEAKRENVDLQLEAGYRQRLAQVHQAVKKRLDYQVDILNTRRQFEQSHMVNWIVKGVTQSITPQQEKESLAKCMQDLKALSVKA